MPFKKSPKPTPLIAEAPKITTVVYFDTETTGLNEPNACEIGAVKAAYDGKGKRLTRETFETYIKPPKPIEFEAMGVNHITNEMVADAPGAEDATPAVGAFFDGADILVAHNIQFDLGVMDRDFPGLLPTSAFNLRCMDTQRLAQQRWDDLPSYKLQVLRYRYRLDDREKVEGDAHRAVFDTMYCLLLVEMLLEEGKLGNLGTMVAKTQELIKLAVINFGKHYGARIEDVLEDDPEYVEWLLRQEFVAKERPDLYYTLTGRPPADWEGRVPE